MNLLWFMKKLRETSGPRIHMAFLRWINFHRGGTKKDEVYE